MRMRALPKRPRSFAFLLALVLAASIGCATPATPPPSARKPAGATAITGATTHGSAETAKTPEGPRTKCPPAFGASGSCRFQASAVTCTYPEGTCVCAQPCRGGARPPPYPRGPLPNPFVWRCTKTPPAVRADGCPGVLPDEGTPCTGARDCSYMQGCTAVGVTCHEGHWSPAHVLPPPP